MPKVLAEVGLQGGKFLIEKAGKALGKKTTKNVVKQGFKEVGGTKLPPQIQDFLGKHTARHPEDIGNVNRLFEGTKGPDSEDAYEGLNDFLHTGMFGEAESDKIASNALANPGRKVANVTPQKSWNLWDEITSDENIAKYRELSNNNPGNFVDDGLAFQNELQLGENSNLYKYLNEQGNEVNAEFAAFLQTVDPETRASYIDLLIEAADDDELAQKVLRDQFEVLKTERLPAERITQEGGERLTPDLINQAKDATGVYQGAQADLTKRGMGDKVLSALSTSPELISGDARIYNLGTEARKLFAEYEQLLEGVDQPTLQWHHKFQKAVSTPYFQRAWELVESGDATVEDIIAMHRYALEQGVGAGDRLSAIMMIERIPHTELHNFAKAAGLQPSQATVKGNKYDVTGKRTRRRPSTNSELKANSNRISKIGNIAELAEDFQRSVQDAMQVTEEGMKIQQAWREIPVTERSRLAHYHNLRKVQTDLLRKNSRKKLSAEEILNAEKEYARLNSIYKKIKIRILEMLEKNRSAEVVNQKVPFSKSEGT